MSVNNIYMTVTTPPFKRYRKTLPSKLSGHRLNAEGDKDTVFVLESHPSGEDRYDSEVLEIYSDRENRYLLQTNRAFFEMGLLKEVQDTPESVSTVNMLTDDEIQEIAATRTTMAMKQRLEALTSKVALVRILEAAKEIGRPKKTLEMIESYIKARENA